jgi:MFS family permease
MDAARHPRQPALLATIFMLNSVEFLQTGMIAFSASAIMGRINASPDEFVFATVLYAAIAITAIATQHWMVERLGWRAFVQLSVALFVVGGAICATSGSLAPFLLGRAIMACGGGGFMTTARLLINLIPPSPERLKGIAAFGTALALGNALAPWVAVSAFDTGNWSAIFAIPSAIAALAVVFANACLPRGLTSDKDRSQSSPWLAASIFCVSLLSLYAVQRAVYDFYSDAVPLLVCLIAGLAGGWLVIRQQRRHARPMIAFLRLMHPRYLIGLAVFSLCYVILGANNAMLPLLLQRSLGAPWRTVGTMQTIGLMSSLLAFVAMVMLLKRWPSARKFYVAGFAFLFFFAWQLSRLTPEASLWGDVLPAIAAFGAFLILAMVTTAIHSFADLQNDPIGFNHGQMVKNMGSQFGVALGVAGSTLLMQWRISEHTTTLAERFHGGSAVFVGLRDQLNAGMDAPQTVAQLSQLLTQQANLLAGLEYYSLLMVVAVALVGIVMVQRVFK